MQRTILGISFALCSLIAVAASAQTAQPPAIKELHRAHHLLVEADHDYGGHRAKAAEEVHKALKELGHAKPHVPGTGKPKSGGEPQPISDAQLKEAQQLLREALPHLHKGHPRAHANVEAAIAQITAALEYRKTK
jgi:hypothetical protein